MSFSLYVMRHGKSDWSDRRLADHDRPLRERGRKAAKRMGRMLAKRGEAPELVLCSSAQRALETAELAAGAGDWQAPIEVQPELYEAATVTLLELVRRRGGSAPRLLLCGHEPGLSSLVAALCCGTRVALPTAAIARVDWEGLGWQELAVGHARLAWLCPPRLLR